MKEKLEKFIVVAELLLEEYLKKDGRTDNELVNSLLMAIEDAKVILNNDEAKKEWDIKG